MNAVEVKNIDGTYTLYNSNGDIVGRVCTETGKAMIGHAFYDKVRTCHMVKPEWAGPKSRVKVCSECGVEFKTWLERYCSYCGAQVIEE